MTPANPNHPAWGGKRQPRANKKIGRPRMHPSGLSRFYINLSPDDLAGYEKRCSRAELVARMSASASRTALWGRSPKR